MADETEKIKIVKSILNLHPNGADIHTIRREYEEMQGEKLENSSAEATALMWRIPDIQDIRGRFFSKSKNSEHITKLVQEQRQKPPMQRRASCYFDRDRVNEDGSHTRNSLNWSASRNRSPLKSWGGDRNRSKSSVRPSTSTSSRWSNNSSAERSRAASPPPSTRYNSRPQNDAQPLLGLLTRDPRINNNLDRDNDKMNETMQSSAVTQTDVQFQRFAIVADDFLFSLILERTLFTQDVAGPNYENMLEPKWSYCVVGQTIADAITLIKAKNLDDETKEIPLEPVKVIVNIGAADICRGTNFREMAENFMELLDTCHKLNMDPTITTVLPFGATERAEEISWKANAFNKFLLENFTNVIDLWACFSIGLSRMLGSKFEMNGVSARFSGRENDISWEHEDEQMVLQHRGKS